MDSEQDAGARQAARRPQFLSGRRAMRSTAQGGPPADALAPKDDTALYTRGSTACGEAFEL